MVILNYSGRGKGRGGGRGGCASVPSYRKPYFAGGARGRGRGRGRGHPATAVASYGRASSNFSYRRVSSVSSTESMAGSAPTSSSWSRASTSEASNSNSNNSSNKWTRPKDQLKNGAASHLEASEQSIASSGSGSGTVISKSPKRKHIESASIPQTDNYEMKRTDKFDEKGSSVANSEHKIQILDETKKTIRPGPTAVLSPLSMKRLGSHKLVLKTETSNDGNAGGYKVSAEIGKIGTGGKASLGKIGHNKLVSKSKPAREAESHHRFHHKKRPHPEIGYGSPYRKAQRIQIVNTSPTQNDDESASNESGLEEGAGEAEKLSDFAYRETRQVVGRAATPSMKWTAEGGTKVAPAVVPRSMGLVRVQVDESRTPICPTFLRGVHCKNKFCTKRHDVPKEHAMPVCSYFQRLGQCLKGDECQFRHVKVNSRTTALCPSFAKRGFCDDKDCTMMHVRPNHGKRALVARKGGKR